MNNVIIVFFLWTRSKTKTITTGISFFFKQNWHTETPFLLSLSLPPKQLDQNDYRLSLSSRKLKLPNICWLKPLKHENLLLFFPLYHCCLNIFSYYFKSLSDNENNGFLYP